MDAMLRPVLKNRSAVETELLALCQVNIDVLLHLLLHAMESVAAEAAEARCAKILFQSQPSRTDSQDAARQHIQVQSVNLSSWVAVVHTS